MKDKAVSIDLDTNVEVGEEHVIVPGDHATFRKKNTEKYKGLLSNMSSLSGDGWMTTTNKEVELVSDDGITAVLDIDGKQYNIPSSLKLIGTYSINPNIAGDITSVVSDGTFIYYILRDKLNNVYKISHKLDGSATDSEVLLGTGEEKTFNAFFLLGSTNYAISTDLLATIYDKDGTQLATVNYTTSHRAANNGWWQDSSNYAVGRDDNDQYYAYSFANYSNTLREFKYMGCIDEKGYITGEPFPCDGVNSMTITYVTPTRLTNGILRWLRWETGPVYNSNTDFSYNSGDGWDVKTVEDYTSTAPNKIFHYSVGGIQQSAIQNEHLNTWVMMITPTGIRSRNRISYSVTSPNWLVTSWIVTDPGTQLGNAWKTSTKTEYDSVFPMEYVYTNKQANRGKTFAYGKGWVRSYVMNGGVYQFYSTTPSANGLFYPFSSDTYVYEAYGDTTRVRYLDANKSGNGSTYSQTNKTPVPLKDNNGDKSELIDSTVYWGKIRVHPITSDQLNNKSWNEWLWTIGGSNTGNNAFLSDIPHYVKYGDLAVLGYSGYTIGFSWNKVLINTPSKEIDVWSHYDYDGKHIIATSENVYVLGAGAFKLRKIADYIFATNCVTEWNTLQESRDGVIKLIRSFIPYNMAFEINSQFRSLVFKCPEDASSANASWMTGAAVNANLSDDYLTSSFLLPAIEIPIYINSGDINTYNKTIVDGNLPILVPTKNDLLFDDEELMVYYTHSQMSTDIIYRETLKGSDAYFNPDYEDNSWWLTSTTIFMPIGIAAKLSGINYMNSTVALEGDYTARLHVQNNQAYEIYNIAEQVYYGGTIFTIYTNNYYYDGEAIYSIIQGSNAEFVCYAIGLKFLGNSGTEAYFYSPYDKSIYLFSGSNTLSKTRSLADMGNITDSMFSSVNQRMYLLDDNSKVLWLSNESSGLFEMSNIDHLESSEKGAIFVGNNKYIIMSPRGDFPDIEKIDLETSWIGDNTALNKFNFASIQLYSPQPIAAKIRMLFMTKDGTDIKEQIKEVNIKKSDWKGTYLRLRATPENAIGQAFKLKVNSEDLIHVMNIDFAFEQVSNNPAPAVPEISV